MDTTAITGDSLHSIERLYGWLLEADGADLEVEFRAGAVDGDIIIGPVHVAANKTASHVLGKPTFWQFPSGVYVKVIAGTAAGQLYHDNF